MKKLKSRIYLLMIAVVLGSLMPSCLMTKTSVGAYQETAGVEYSYAKGKQFWLFWGLIPLGRTSVKTPLDGNCEVVTKFTFVDFLVSGLTGGLISSYTIKVNAKEIKY